MGDPFCSCKLSPSPITAPLRSQRSVRSAAHRPNGPAVHNRLESVLSKCERLKLENRALQLRSCACKDQGTLRLKNSADRRKNSVREPKSCVVQCCQSEFLNCLATYVQIPATLLPKATLFFNSGLPTVHLSDSLGSANQIVGELAVALQKYPSSLATILIPMAGSAIRFASTRNRKEDRSASKDKEIIDLEAESIRSLRDGFESGDVLPTEYDPEAITNYFRRRPFLVLSRAALITSDSSFLVAKILIDLATKKTNDNETLRAAQLVDLITRLGPTAVKVGQALSIRPDLLPATYLEALQKLQDRVPPFSNEVAKYLISEELGQAIDEIYSEFSADPVAAASLGQVYKAKLRVSGEAVAVKVQRPRVLEEISLDLFILRLLAKAMQKLPGTQTDIISLLDHWAIHFFHELDYRQEAKNAEDFRRSMRSLANIVVPRAYMQYTSRKVLTTTWIEGHKFSESKEGDLAQLVSTSLNCYLIQLLESGFLHGDPHPGNLLRTPDGRLCVLDFGLMIQVTEDQRYALIDYISHLVNADYEKVPNDLIRLGFVPPDMVNHEKTAEILPQLSRVLSKLVRGGGFRQIDIQQITDDLAGMANEYNIVIPPYFALILRAFSMLEGIGLKSNPDYAIVEECYPYICKRLLTDDSPRARIALKYFLYGDGEQLNVRRVEGVLIGFKKFRKQMMPTAESENSKFTVPSIDSTSKQVLFALFAPEGSFLQEVLLTELVRVVDALSREALFELFNGFNRAIFPFSSFISPPIFWPSPVRGLFFGVGSVTKISTEDQEALNLVRRLQSLVGSELSRLTIADVTGAADSVTALIPDLSSGVSAASMRFWLMLLHRKALRLADDLDGKNSLTYWNRDPAAYARHIKPLTFLPGRKVNDS